MGLFMNYQLHSIDLHKSIFNVTLQEKVLKKFVFALELKRWIESAEEGGDQRKEGER